MFSIKLSKAKLGFSAAHFLVTHEKCSRLHGHNYKVGVAVRGEQDDSGMVIDFNPLTKEAEKICREMDQRVIIPGKSTKVTTTKRQGEVEIILPDRRYLLPEEDVVILPIRASTAEALAEYIHLQLSKVIEGLVYVEVEESPGSVARYQPG